MTSDETRRAVNAMIGYVAIRDGEDIVSFTSCMWCKRTMPVVNRRINPNFDTRVCAGCNASA